MKGKSTTDNFPLTKTGSARISTKLGKYLGKLKITAKPHGAETAEKENQGQKLPANNPETSKETLQNDKIKNNITSNGVGEKSSALKGSKRTKNSVTFAPSATNRRLSRDRTNREQSRRSRDTSRDKQHVTQDSETSDTDSTNCTKLDLTNLV